MLDKDFYISLEYAISEALAASTEEAIKGFWCDGVMPVEPDSHYSPKHVNDHRAIRLRAFVGKDGQTEYDLVVKFGPKALSRYSRGLSIQDCITANSEENWLTIDTNARRIEVKLT